MDDSGIDGSEVNGESARAASRDGRIQFADYSDTQLNDLIDTIDQVRFPLNYGNLQAEIARRAAFAVEVRPATNFHVGRFTHRDGLHGWAQATKDRSPIYGSGAIEIRSGEVVFNGWQRTWLGAPIQVQLAFPVHGIRNVTLDGVFVAFQIIGKYRFSKRIAFTAESPADAANLVAKLPTVSSPGFARQWADVRDFNARLRSVEQKSIVTPTLVATNVLVFVAIGLVTKRVGNFDIQTLINWGANFGPLTVNGQWWRLGSALFLHINLLHLVLNMWALWNIGRLCERLFGRFTLAFLYFSCGAISSLASIVWNPSLTSVGASGAIFGIFGAFLSFYLNPRNQVPRTVARQHWVSTVAFTAFSLVNGALQPAIDNAAHVGGLIGGLILGWIIARPIEPSRRHAFSATQYSGAVVFIVFVVVLAIWQVKGIGSELTVTEQYLRRHSAYLDGESKNLALWSEMAARAGNGTMSDLELGQRFERDILPFWKSAHEQLDTENLTLAGPQRPYALLVADFVRLRFEWAQKIIDAVQSRDPQLAAEAQAYIQKTTMAQARLERFNIRAQMDHRPRALVNNPFVSKLRNALTGYRWQCLHRPVSWTPIPSTTDDPRDGPSERNRVGCLAQQLFMTGDYGELDSLMARYARTLGDLPDGSSRYEGVMSGLDALFAFGGTDGLELLGRTADWRRNVQGSRRSDLVESMIFQATAWTARGYGAADSVSAQNWLIFAYRTEMASAALADTKDSMQGDPAWYAEELSVALDQSQTEDQIRAIFNEGFTRFPSYRPLERAMLRILMPRWSGSYEKVDQFINGIYKQTARTRGFERYAELYSEYAHLEGDELNLFLDTQAFWSGMQIGYVGLLKRYPNSDFVLNQFTNMACRAGDGEQFQELRPLIAKRYSSAAWSKKYSLESCDKQLLKAAWVTEKAGNVTV